MAKIPAGIHGHDILSSGRGKTATSANVPANPSMKTPPVSIPENRSKLESKATADIVSITPPGMMAHQLRGVIKKTSQKLRLIPAKKNGPAMKLPIRGKNGTYPDCQAECEQNYAGE